MALNGTVKRELLLITSLYAYVYVILIQQLVYKLQILVLIF